MSQCSRRKGVVAVAGILLLVLCLQRCTPLESYPIITEVAPNSEKCFRYNIPEDDDAHFLFLAVPGGHYTSAELEEWFVKETYQLTKARSRENGVLPRNFKLQPPEHLLKQMDDFRAKHQGVLSDGGSAPHRVMMKLALPRYRSSPIRQQVLPFYVPNVINHVRRAARVMDPRHRSGDAGGGSLYLSGDDLLSLEGYQICLENSNHDDHDENIPAHVIFDAVLNSQEPTDDEIAAATGANAGKITKKHLTPLEEKLASSIAEAHAILHQMRYMESRERRMRQTADSINSRIRYFSYLSVLVLLAVTYLQVTYLKQYFRKKKLL